MREIKFRAWDKKDELMYVEVHEGITFDDESHYSFIDFLNSRGYHEFEIMQYTGLKDKNGKEIYEGDVVRRSYVRTQKYVTKNNEIKEGNPVVQKYRPKVIKWSDGGFNIRNGEKIEVIGNIYENPELLE